MTASGIDMGSTCGDPRMMRAMLFIVSGMILVLAGCHGGSGAVRVQPRVDASPIDAAAIADRDPRTLTIFDGSTGEPIAWQDLIAAIADADAIILGEQHDDGVGHAAQLAIVQDVAALRSHLATRGALAMEMLERDEQAVTDDYLEGLIDAPTLATLTHSTTWAGEGSWANWYQPIIDAARDAGWRVIAANAPRRYVRLARTHGYERLRELPAERRALIALPRTWPLDYRQRFVDVMSAMRHEAQPQQPPSETVQGATDDAAAHEPPPPAAAAHGPIPTERINASFRSQLLWDSTMADSIARARRAGAKPVIHLVGQFHSDFNGGTVQELRARLGRNARIATVSMQRREQDALHDDDHGRADFVIYTGVKPAPDAPESPESPDVEETTGSST